MIDVVFLAHNRLEFTKQSFATLKANTDWTDARLIVYDDASTDGTKEWLEKQGRVIHVELGSPVAVMNRYLSLGASEYWAKIDNDTLVPPGWLEICRSVMNENPGLELLGIEATQPLGIEPYSFVTSDYIGGIGLFKASAWSGRPSMEPNGRFGFTAWQDKYFLRAGWLNPSLPVCLLNRVPVEPWISLSKKYLDVGWQRDAEQYTDSRLWTWWQ